MSIFVLDEDVNLCASYMCDKHIENITKSVNLVFQNGAPYWW